MNPLIVIIDDSLCTRKILEVTLRRAGYDAYSFPDGPSAIEWLNLPERRIPALIFVDLVLPRMDGYTLLRRLKARRDLAYTVFVMLSGRSGVVDRLKGRLAGARVYLTKPFTQQAVHEVIRTQLGPPDALSLIIRHGTRPAARRSPLHPVRLAHLEVRP